MAPTAVTDGDVWEVVGGASSGGIIVRSGKDKSSPECSDRLSTGAKIRIVEATGCRAGYELISGEGPQSGWVTAKFQGKDLLARIEVESGERALEEYCMRFGEEPRKEQGGFQRKAFPWIGRQQFQQARPQCNKQDQHQEQQVQEELETEMGLQHGVLECKEERKPQKIKLSATAKQANIALPGSQIRGWAEDSDGDDVRICQHCNLPLGDFAYNRAGNCVHGECMAQLMVQDMRTEENARIQSEKVKKAEQHSAYGIGWTPLEHIPRNDEAASKLAMRDVPQGMVCLVLDEITGSIRVGATREPATAVNLEYLSTALQVRRIEGHEPVFSLEPVDAEDKNTMHEKVFVPEWLAGTSAGEVLFQSDYHLKELSMGEYEQPVVGMKSCFDFTEIDGNHDWNAREWFLVRKAEVLISDENVFIPMVKMGVEAREQVVNGNSLEDKPVTFPEHPMVKYATAFTQNFDLIAERKSAIFHLRELAKASVMAKYLLDVGAGLEESWFNLVDKVDTCSLQVPQLWNERIHSQVRIKDGSIQRDRCMEVTHGVYGGVQFGLDKFNLAHGGSLAGPGAGVQALALSIGRPGVRQAVPLVTSIAGRPAAGIQALSLAPGVTFAPRLARPGMPTPAAAASLATTIEKAAAGVLPTVPGRLAFGLSRKAAVAPLSSLLTQGLPGPSVPTAPPLGQLSGSAQQWAVDMPKAAEAITGKPIPGLRFPRISAMPVGVTDMPGASLSALMGSEVKGGVPISVARQAGLDMRPDGAAIRHLPVAGIPRLQGVDLRLDQFDLSEATRVSLEVQTGSWGAKSLDSCVAVGSAFFDSLDSSNKLFKDADNTLLLKVFNPALSDRRSEQDLFVPPDASYSYVQQLRALVKEEDMVRESREEAFFSEEFAMDNPGYLFPHSWTPSFAVEDGHQPSLEGRQGNLRPRPEYVGGQARLLEHLKASAPVFDKTTEEGLRFRIYRIGSLEVRTKQERGENEVVGAVFSLRAPKTAVSDTNVIDEREKITKVMEYLERVDAATGDAKRVHRRYFLVIETEKGNTIVTERHIDGKLSWIFNPHDLDDRCSLAKLSCHADCSNGVTIRDMMNCRAKLAEGSTLSSKRFVQAMFIRAAGSKGGTRPSNRDFSHYFKV